MNYMSRSSKNKYKKLENFFFVFINTKLLIYTTILIFFFYLCIEYESFYCL